MNLLHHAVEHLPALLTVGYDGVALTVASEPYAATQHIHGVDVLHPLGVNRRKQALPFVFAEVLARLFESGFQGVVFAERHFEHSVLHLVHIEHPAKLGGDDPARLAVEHPYVEVAVERLYPRVVELGLEVRVLGDDFLRKVVYHVHNLVVDIQPVQHLAALLVYHLALGVHDIVVAQHLLPHREVAAFHILLCALYLLGDEAVCDGLRVVKVHSLGDGFHLVAAEKPCDVVLHGDVERGAAGVALPAASASQLVVDSSAVVTLGAYDAQSAELHHLLVLRVALHLVFGVVLPVLLPRLPDLVADAVDMGGRHLYDIEGIPFPLKPRLGEIIRVAAQHDVRAAPRHVGGDGHRADLARLSDDFRLVLVVLGVQDLVAYALAFEQIGKLLGFLHAHRAHQHGLSALVALHDVIDNRVELAAHMGVDAVVLVLSPARLVRGDGDDIQRVYALELVLFRLGGARHARELAVHPEKVLESDCGEGLVLVLDCDALLRLHRLVQTVVVASADEHASRELVHNQNLAVGHDVVAVALHDEVRLQRALDVAVLVGVLGVGDVEHPEISLRLRDAVVGEHDGLFLLVDGVILGRERADKRVGGLVELVGLVAPARDDERRARLVDEDGVHLVDDGEVEPALHLEALALHHVVAQKIEAELVVGAVGDVAGIGGALVVRGLSRDDDADGKPHETVHFAHPRRVAGGEVIVDGHHMDAVARERVEIGGKHRNQRLAFARRHLGDSALVQRDCAHDLLEEGAQPQHPVARLAHCGVGVIEHIVELFAARDARPELLRHARQFLVGQLFILVRERVHLPRHAADFVQFPFVFVENPSHFLSFRACARIRARIADCLCIRAPDSHATRARTAPYNLHDKAISLKWQ